MFSSKLETIPKDVYVRSDLLRRPSEKLDRYKYIFKVMFDRKLLLTLNMYNLLILWFKEEKKGRGYAP